MMKETIRHNGKRMYLDYQTDNLLDAKPIIKSYHWHGYAYHVRKNCLGVYSIYCEHPVRNPVGHVDLG